MPRRRASRRSDDPWSTPEEGSLVVRVALGLVERARLPLALAGVDAAHLRELLRARLVLSLRPALDKANVFGSATMAVGLVMPALFGAGTGIVALVADDPGTWIVSSQTALALLLMLVLLQFLGNILVDPTDVAVLSAHPVPDRALFAARLCEMFFHLGLFATSFSVGNAAVASFGQPLVGTLLVLPLLSLLCGLTSLGAVALLFVLCLRLVGPVRFQRVTLWAQILSGVVLFGAMQLSRGVRREQWGLWLERYGSLVRLWPPRQYADLYAFLMNGGGARLSALAAVVVPFVALVVTLWLASRTFIAGLQGTISTPGRPAGWPHGPLVALGRRLVRPAERVGFDYAAALSRREPAFLRTVLPQVMMFQAMAVGLWLRDEDLTMMVSMSLASLTFVLPNVLIQSQGTLDPQARSVFLNAPVESEAVLLRGAVKGLIVQWLGLPIVLIGSALILLLGPGVLPKILFGMGLSWCTALALARRFRIAVPFTQPVRHGKQQANFGLMMLSGMVLGVQAVVYALVTLHPIGTGVGLVGVLVAIPLLWKRLDRLEVDPTQVLRPLSEPVAYG